MGFNKRYVSIETLSHIIENENDLIRYFKNADALIFIDDIKIRILKINQFLINLNKFFYSKNRANR